MAKQLSAFPRPETRRGLMLQYLCRQQTVSTFVMSVLVLYCTVLYCTVLYCTVLMLQYLCLTANSLHLRYVGIGIVKTLSQWPSRQRRAILLMRRLVLTPTPHLSTFWYCLLPRNMIAPLSPSIMSNISICWHFCFCKRMTQVFH